MKISRKWLLTGVMLCGFGAQAAEDFGRPPFAVPPRLGSVTDYWRPTKDGKILRLDEKPLVVMIQDLHANVGVQKNIASILYRLNRINKEKGLVVCVEGASGEGDVSLLRSLPGPIRRGFEEMLLRRAYLTGAELAATETAADVYQQGNVLWSRFKSYFVKSSAPAPVSISSIHLWGVDDPDLYRKNWRAAKKVDKQGHAALNYVRPTKAFLSEGANKALKNHLALLTKLFLLRLQPEEYKEYLKGRAMNPGGPPIYTDTLKAAEEYYQAADDRSYAMARNVLQRMGNNPGVIVLISGGFHTHEIAEIFKKKGVSYAVVTPHVEVLDQDQAYKARLREEE
jgi:hypothetical protein